MICFCNTGRVIYRFIECSKANAEVGWVIHCRLQIDVIKGRLDGKSSKRGGEKEKLDVQHIITFIEDYNF